MVCGVYGIFGPEEECLYVGMSKDIGNRWKGHLKQIKNGSHPRTELIEWCFHNGGVESLTFQVLELVEASEDLGTVEIKWFENLKPKFYGQVPRHSKAWSHSEKTKEKIRQTVLARLEESGGRDYLKPMVCGYCGNYFTRTRSRVGNPQKFCTVSCGAKSRSKLTKEDRAEIRNSYPAKTQQELGRQFGISHTAIQNVLKEEI